MDHSYSRRKVLVAGEKVKGESGTMVIGTGGCADDANRRVAKKKEGIV